MHHYSINIETDKQTFRNTFSERKSKKFVSDSNGEILQKHKSSIDKEIKETMREFISQKN